MKDPSDNERAIRLRAVTQSFGIDKRVVKPRSETGISRWRALERRTFQSLTAPPSSHSRPKGGS
jgi:hypothetical protein